MEHEVEEAHGLAEYSIVADTYTQVFVATETIKKHCMLLPATALRRMVVDEVSLVSIQGRPQWLQDFIRDSSI